MMSVGVAAYADEATEPTVTESAPADVPSAPSEPAVSSAPSAPSAPVEPTPPTTPAAPTAEELAAQQQAKAERLALEKAEAEKTALGFWANESDEQLATYNALLASLGYATLDRTGFATLCASKGIADISAFESWLEGELALAANAVAMANGVRYLTLDEALTAATESSRTAELTLMRDIAVNGFAVPDDKEIYLDLNGHTLALTGNAETPSYFIVCQNTTELDANGNPIYTHGSAHVKNGRIVASPGAVDGIAVINEGTLTLSNVAVDGNIVMNAADAQAYLSVEPGQFGENAFLNGKLVAEPGTYTAISVTGGLFAGDVSAYVDSALYFCILNEQGIYAVTPKSAAPTQNNPTDSGNGTTLDDDKPADNDSDKLNLPVPTVSEDASALSFENTPAGFEAASLTLTGLKQALDDKAMAELVTRYMEAMSGVNAVATLALDADTPTSSDEESIAVRLFVKAKLTAAEEGKTVTYEVKPYADINGTELPIENELLGEKARLTLSFYTGFCPEILMHDHQDGSEPEVIKNSDFTYNNGVVTLIISDFSAFIANASGGKTDYGTLADALAATADGDTITLSGNETITDTISITKNVTIDLKNYSLTYTNATEPMFCVENNATLTVIGAGTLDAGSAPIAKLYNGTVKLGNDTAPSAPDYAANLGRYNTSATTPFELVGSESVANIRRAVTNFDPSAYVDTATYTVYDTTSAGLTSPKEYTVKLAPAARVGLAATGTEYETLKEALNKANTGDTVYLLRSIDDGDITLDKSLTVNGSGGLNSTPWTITGNINAIGAGISPSITSLAVSGSVTASEGVTALTLTNVTLTKPADAATAATVSVAQGASLTATKLSCDEISVAGDAADATTRHNVRLLNATANSVTIGSNMNKVELLGVTADNVTVGDNITDIKLHSNAVESATSINTLTIGANNKTVSIEHGTTNYPIEIGSLSVGMCSVATLGSLNTAVSVSRLQVESVTSLGALIKINSGSYATLNGDGTQNSIALYGGTYTEIVGETYPAYLERYCACDLKADKTHYDHRAVTAGAVAGTWVVGVFEPMIESPASGMTAVSKGYSGTLTFITNIPYSHAAHGGAEPCIIGVTVDRSTISSVLPATDYTVTNDNGRLAVTLNSGYLSALPSGTYYIKVDSELGTAERMTDGTLAGFKVNLTSGLSSSSSGRLSGLIRTGDDANLGLLVGVMVVAAAVAVGAVVVLKKKGKK